MYPPFPLRVFLEKWLSFKGVGGGTPLTDKIRQVVFGGLPYADMKKYATAVTLATATILNTPLFRFPALEDFFSQDFLLVLARWNKIYCQLLFMDL